MDQFSPLNCLLRAGRAPLKNMKIKKQLDSNELSSTIQKALNFLEKDQHKNGSFLGKTSPKPEKFAATVTSPITFFAPLILSCLNTLVESNLSTSLNQQAGHIRERAA